MSMALSAVANSMPHNAINATVEMMSTLRSNHFSIGIDSADPIG